MSTNEMNFKVKELRELRRMREELDAEIAAAEDSIKAEMTARDVDTLAGDDWKITWRTVRGSRFDSAAFKKANQVPDCQPVNRLFTARVTDEAGSFDVTFFGALDGGEADCRLVCRLQASRFKQFPKFRLSYLQGEKFVEQFPEKFLPLTGNTGGETSFSPVFPGFLRGLTVELNEI